LDYLVACSFLKKMRVQKIFSSSQLNCSGARHKYSIQELKKAQLELCSLKKSRREGSFDLARCLGRAARTEEGRLTEEGDTGIRGGNWVICYSWAVRAARVVLKACSEVFWHSVSSWR